MIYFLTSYYAIPGTNVLNPANGFADALKAALPQRALRCVCLASSPEDTAKSERYGYLTRDSLTDAGLRFESYDLLDDRNRAGAAALIEKADLLIFSGGHTPTQNRFFAEIGLKKQLRGFDGVILGISAGTMNCASTVYAHPEREGEAVDEAYCRFLPGLGLTQTMVLPHHNTERHTVLDGLRTYEDIAFPDSMDRSFYSLPDGTYLWGDGHTEELRGEAYRIRDGHMERISTDGQVLRLS